ncbi:MAG: M23 family metallopeptidase [Candidatus Nanopelagicales bacterium]
MKPGAHRRAGAGAAIAALWATVALTLMSTHAVAAQPSQDWIAPIGSSTSPPVVAGFDPPSKPWLAGHRGVDLAASIGTPIRAAGAGTITFAGQIAGRGVVTLTHGELRTTYEPVDATVGYGQRVAPGTVIGTVGIGGHCSVTCVHWGLLRGDEYLDPLLLLTWEPPVLKSLRRSGELRATRHDSRSQEPAATARRALRSQQEASATTPTADVNLPPREASPQPERPSAQATRSGTESAGPSTLAAGAVIAGSLAAAGVSTWLVRRSRR